MASPPRVLLTDRAWPDCEVERQILSSIGAEVIDAPDPSEAALAALARDADAIATCWAQVTPAVIEAATRCRVVARFGIGLDNIAIDTATSRGIPVTYVPDYCVPEVSDHALALLLAVNRKVAFFHHQTKQGHYELGAGPPLKRLNQLQLGLIGFGRIGRALFSKATALGLRLVAHTPSGHDYGTGCPMVTLETLLHDSDFVSLHLPLNESTRHLINRERLALMLPDAWIINTSRGGLIDHDALQTALASDQIGGAALDVFEPEPPELSHDLFRDERVIVTPHAAFLSEDSLRELRSRTAQQVVDVLSGVLPEHVVNPEVCEHLAPRT